MVEVLGECPCGNISIQLALSDTPDRYNPRVCDCDFCVKHGAAYISDAKGYVRLRIASAKDVIRLRQGAELAEMILCGRCTALVGATYREGEQILATINARLLRAAGFGTDQSVSPKSLSASEKVLRWKKLWFQDVQISPSPPNIRASPSA